jgi:lipopolysaccharide export system protein LptA
MKLITPARFGLFGPTSVVVLLAVASRAVHPTLASTSVEALSGIQQDLTDDVLSEQDGGANQHDGDLGDGRSIEAQPKARDAQDRAKHGDSVVQLEPIPGVDQLLAAPSACGASSSRRGVNADRSIPGLVAVGLPQDLRKTSLFPRNLVTDNQHGLTIRQPPDAPDGRRTLIIQGGVHIVSQSPKSGMIDIEANEAEIHRPLYQRDNSAHGASDETWVDDENRPMEIHLKGNVVVRQDPNGVRYFVDRRIIRAERVDYEFSTDRLTAINAVVITLGSHAPSEIRVDRISLPPLVPRQPVQSRTSADDSGSNAR